MQFCLLAENILDKPCILEQIETATTCIVLELQNVILIAPFCQELLDSHGCSLYCSTLSDAAQENQFIVARNEVSHKFQRVQDLRC